jgi:hypothetical protein
MAVWVAMRVDGSKGGVCGLGFLPVAIFAQMLVGRTNDIALVSTIRTG